MSAIGARRSRPSPRPRLVTPVDTPYRMTKEEAPCCTAQRDDLGRLPIGYCGPWCIRRSLRQGESLATAVLTWRDAMGDDAA